MNDKVRFDEVLKLATQFKERFEKTIGAKKPTDDAELQRLREEIENLGYMMTFVQVNDENGTFVKLQLAIIRIKKRGPTVH